MLTDLTHLTRMLTNKKNNFIESVLDEADKTDVNLETIAVTHDDFFDLCSPLNIDKNDSENSNMNLLHVQRFFEYAKTDDSNNETFLDENAIFERQTQCVDLFNKIESEIEELSSSLNTLNEACDGLQDSEKTPTDYEYNFKKIRKDFLIHKEIMRNIATKIFNFKSDEFLYLLNTLLKMDDNVSENDDKYLDISQLNISAEVVDKLLRLQIIQQAPSDSKKISLSGICSTIKHIN